MNQNISLWSFTRAIPTLALLFLALGLFPGASAHAARRVPGGQDWPMYLHDPQRTSASGETILSTTNVAQLNKLWSFKTGGVIASSATVVGGTVYVGSWDGNEYALDATTGALKWKTFLGVTNANPICIPPSLGVSSSAAVQNGVVYLGGGDSFWYALDANTGAVLWKVFTGDNSAASGHYNWSSPLLYNGFAYIGVASVGDCPLVQGQLIQVNLSTHQVVNTLNIVPNGQVGGGIWATPSLDAATNTIFVTTGTENLTTQQWAQAFLAINASTLTVTASWKLPESEAVLDSDFGTTPTLFSDAAGDQLVAAINKNGAAYAFNRNNLPAGPIWQQQIAIGGDCPTCGQSSVSSGAFGGGRLYLAGETTTINGRGYQGSVRALDPATGNILWEHGTTGPVIGALAYTNGLVIDGAGDMLEVLDAATGKRLYSYELDAGIFSPPSISQGQIFIGSEAGTVYSFSLGTPITPPADPHCPNGWTCQDIGNPTPAGTETVSSGTWNVSAGGAGIGGAADQFRLLSEASSGDTQITAQITALPSGNSGYQVGLMMRQRNDPGSPYYGVFLTPNKGLVVQYRTAFGGATTVANQMTTGGLPLYLEIQRVGDQFQVGTSTDGTTYTLVPASTAIIAMPALALAGLAASSGVNGMTGTATYKNVVIGSPGNPPNPPPSPSPCPANWSCSDIGNPLLIGDQALNNGTWTVKGAGGDIWEESDQFHYVWQSLAADGTISAHVLSQTNTDPSAKAGVMLRQNSNATSAYYAAYVTPGNGIQVQYRTSDGYAAAQAVSISGTTPAYLEIARSGTSFTTYTSTDGVTWTPIGQSTVTIAMTGTVLAGLAVTSHNTTALSTATYDTVTLGTTAPPPPNLCPTNWNCADIGFATPAGEQTLNNGTWTVYGGGGDIWNTSDQFHYVWQSLAGDGSVSAHVITQTNTDPWAKAGVMLRQSSSADDAYYGVYVTPGNGIVVQYRTALDASAQQAAALSGATPAYLQVSRAGNTFTAFTSNDGSNWTPIAGSSVTITMSGTILAGLAVNSHNPSALSSVTYDTVNVVSAAPPPPGCQTGWNCADIGAPDIAGGQSFSNGTWTVQGAGGDIWGTSDQFHYIWQSLSADGTISARVVSQSNTDPWAKAGVMLRQSSSANAAYYAVYVTPGNGIAVQYRPASGASAVMIVGLAGTAPAYLEVARSGNTFTAYTSTNGTAWTPIAGSSVTLSISGAMLAGLTVTSHNVTALSTVTFDTVNINNTAPPPPNACPTNWNCADIGGATPGGAQSLNNGTWTVQGGGGDIWGTSDQFHYLWQSLAADGSVSAHVLTQSNTDPWAKAGVMLRQSSNADSAYYAVYVTPGNGIVVQYRSASGAMAVMNASMSGATPTYLRVGRSGTTFTAYTSANGTTWTPIAGSSVTLGMSGALLAGLAVTSHNGGALSTVTFDTVTIG
ncbi:MAG TPA: PQQ-binding-like beta-propeller repeat protein [Ktedonobacterales bacterium]|nr:PQQ-binding-like beta-propeller repeat protein [Ktedonobacterales bacterium]